MGTITHIKTITEAHQLLGLAKPRHPLISVFYHSDSNWMAGIQRRRFSSDLYMIALKDGLSGAFGYGRQAYDFQEGTLVFVSPQQIISFQEMEVDPQGSAWTILFHPDLIRRAPLGRTITSYSFFSYDTNEALHLSQEEKDSLTELVHKIEKEYSQNMDQHTQDLIIINLESILKYSKRYFERQFLTRSNFHRDYIVRFERYLRDYFASDQPLKKGIPSVEACGRALQMSGHYLSDLLKSETGKSAKEHINAHLIDRAKTLLMNPSSSVSQVAYDLGFAYPQHFSRVFKAQTGQSPSAYRNAS